MSAEGGAWYLGDSVARQSLGALHPYVPKPLPTSMLNLRTRTAKNKTTALKGKPAFEFVLTLSPKIYDEFSKHLATSFTRKLEKVRYV